MTSADFYDLRYARVQLEISAAMSSEICFWFRFAISSIAAGGKSFAGLSFEPPFQSIVTLLAWPISSRRRQS
jgi:hypothetical protein